MLAINSAKAKIHMYSSLYCVGNVHKLYIKGQKATLSHLGLQYAVY